MKKHSAFGILLVLSLAFSGCDTLDSIPPTIQISHLSATPVPLSAVPDQSQKVTAEQVKALALKHAGFSAEDVFKLRAEYDRKDNHWEVEFIHNGWEYEYDIDAVSGEILTFEKDR